MTFRILAVLGLLFSYSNVAAQVKVVTTTSNGADLVKQVGGDKVDVYSLTKGTQDPHYVDAKPSYIMKVARADLLVSVGLELEGAWLPSVLSGARNSSLMPGAKGSLILGKHISPIDVPTKNLSREHGDVHPGGNPHFLLDPIRAGDLALVVAKKLTELDRKNARFYQDNAFQFKKELTEMSKSWQKQVKASGIKTVFTYHKTLAYFLKRMGVKAAASIEPKPGIPPTARHILSLVRISKSKNVRLTLVESLFDASPARKIQKENPAMKIQKVPVAVGAYSNVNSLKSLYRELAASFSKAEG